MNSSITFFFAFWLGGWFTMMWVGIGTGVAGLAAGAYGANKQSKAVKAASAENAAQQDKQNASAWANYLMTRGVNPAGAATGQLPSNPQAINTKLPLWASASFRQPGTQKVWRKKGTGLPPVGRLARDNTFATAPVEALPVASAPAASGPSRTKDLLIGNPLGIGGKDRSFFDPLGIF